MSIDPCMSNSGVLSLCAAEGWLCSEMFLQNYCISRKTMEKGKNIKTNGKVSNEKLRMQEI